MNKKQELPINRQLNKNSVKDTINDNEIFHQYIIKSPSRSSKKFRIKSPQTTKVSFKQKQSYEFMSEMKNKNLIFSNKRLNKKKKLNKVLIDDYKNRNLKKNRSINYLVSLENLNDRNNDKINYNTKIDLTKNNFFYQ